MREVLFLLGIIAIVVVVFIGPEEIYSWYDYRCGYSAGQAEVEEARQHAFGQLGLYFQRDFVGIHKHPDESEAWNEGHRTGIQDALSQP